MADKSGWVFGNPGSPGAVDHGCSCARLDNAHGKGRYGDGSKFGWWISADCPLHGGTPAGEPSDAE